MNCPLCGAGGARRFIDKGRLTVVRCRCGFAFATEDAPDEPYDEAYYRRWGVGSVRETGMAAMKRASYGRVLDLVEGAGRGRGRLLDVGCGMGYSVDEAVARGFDAHGIETSAWAVEAASKRLPGRFTRGMLQAAKFPDGSFDGVTLIDVIEHVRDPLGLLREIGRITRSGGLLALTTPDLSSLSAGVLGSRWPYVIPEHVGYFNRRTLTRSLAMTGWKLRRIGPVRKSLRVDYVRQILESRGDGLGRMGSAFLSPLPGSLDIGLCAGDVVVLAEKTGYSTLPSHL